MNTKKQLPGLMSFGQYRPIENSSVANLGHCFMSFEFAVLSFFIFLFHALTLSNFNQNMTDLDDSSFAGMLGVVL